MAWPSTGRVRDEMAARIGMSATWWLSREQLRLVGAVGSRGCALHTAAAWSA